jgi:hypothetical protein
MMCLQNRWSILGIFLAFTSLFNVAFGQNNLNDLNIIFGHNFENNTAGNYVVTEWDRDWLHPLWVNRQSELDIVSEEYDILNPSKTMQIFFPANSLGPEQGGTSWETDLPEKYEEAYFSYDIKFMPGFEFQAGGKIPGLSGGAVPSTSKPTGYDGFCALMMFKADRPMFYLYYADSPQAQYGLGIEWGKTYAANAFSPSQLKLEYAAGPVYFSTGIWHNLTYRVVLNSVNSNGTGNYDGILEAFFDGRLVTQVSHVLFRHTASLGIDEIDMMSFFGGATDDYRNPISEWLDIDNVLLYTFNSNINVPRGRELSPTDRTITYWRNFRETNTMTPNTPSSLRYTELTNSSVTLKWNDNSSNEYGFEIYRSLSESGSYSLVCTTVPNVTAYIDRSLQSGTNYYYRIRAYNDVGYSDYSSTLMASTSSALIPSTPTGLNATSITYSSALIYWNDNSNNETGFEIERTGPNSNTVVRTFTTVANIRSFQDNSLQMNSTYYYRVRAFIGSSYSGYSSSIMIITPYVQLPVAPTSLNCSDITDKSIKISWADNSYNETGFIISRSLVNNPSDITEIEVGPNSTSYFDYDLSSNTSYIYNVKAINIAGRSANSNNNIATTMSVAETKRIKDGLIAYYNFTYNSDYLVKDLSDYGEPLNLKIKTPSAVSWNDFNRLTVSSSTAITSTTTAKKITEAVKITGEITVECWIKPFEPDISMETRLISLEVNDSETGFALNQYFDRSDLKSLNYGVRFQTKSTNESGYPEIIPNKVLQNLNLQHIVFIHDSIGNESIYMNGVKVKEGFRPGTLDTWNNNFYLTLGNRKDLSQPWKGTFYSVAIYNKKLTDNQIIRNFSLGPCDSIRNNGQEMSITAYPNPTNDFMTIETIASEPEDYVPITYLKLFDVYGVLQYQEIIFNPNNQFIKTFDFSNLVKGIYYLQVISGQNQKTIRIIIQ